MNSLETSVVAPANLATFILAGNATFTVQSEKTDARFTFKVRQPKPDAPHFVSLLNGPDNENDFAFLGTLFANGVYRHGVKSHVSPAAPSAIAARWVVERITQGKPLVNCQIWHEGKCGRCGRKLTVPESIETGLGPECAKRV